VRWKLDSVGGRCIGWFAFGVAIISGHTVALAAAVQLAPHRAVYNITLERTAAGSGVAELTGRMVYEFKGSACKGFEQTIRFVTQTESPKGKQTLMDLRSYYHEDGDAGRFRFETRQFQDERLAETVSGNARRGSNKGAVRVTVKKPRQLQKTFGHHVLFPIQHTIEILEAARAGAKVYVADLYDGSEKGGKLYETTAVFGDRKPPGYNASLPSAVNGKLLDGQASWPVSLSYFDKSKGADDSIPEYELAFLFFENGVSRKLFIDYGSFAIKGRLTRLEMLKPDKCKP
jgi:EipB-like